MVIVPIPSGEVALSGKGVMIVLAIVFAFFYITLGIMFGAVDSKYEGNHCDGPKVRADYFLYPTYKLGCWLGEWGREPVNRG